MDHIEQVYTSFSQHLLDIGLASAYPLMRTCMIMVNRVSQ